MMPLRQQALLASTPDPYQHLCIKLISWSDPGGGQLFSLDRFLL